mmetsp:Transcript_28504/g.25233  ORF Transcript_28504/g.25233 Transcript_28504/m.25233 type:complete len:89 (+) Transcript_28504:247-513(+)
MEESAINRENLVRLQDVQKDYKSSQINPKSQYSRYTSNKTHKIPRKLKHKDSDKTGDISTNKKPENQKPRIKKTKSRRHKKTKNNTSF